MPSGIIGKIPDKLLAEEILMVPGFLKNKSPMLINWFNDWLQNYDSASAALDAYIADFERSPRNSELLTGRLVLPHSPPSMLSRPRVSTLRNKDGRSQKGGTVTEKQHRRIVQIF